MSRFTEQEKNNFYRAADSLRKYRRAELVDDETGQSTLAVLYCDPLPGQGLSTRTNSANTTLIIGRKGTGKSTVFQKLQYDVRKSNNRLTAYIDIKTIWDSSQVDIGLQERVAAIDIALPSLTIQRMLMYRTFLSNVVDEIKRELDKRLKESFLERIKNVFSGRFDDLKNELDAFQSGYSDENFVRILGVKTLALKEHTESKNSKSSTHNIKGSTTTSTANIEASADQKSVAEHGQAQDTQFSDVLLNVFDPASLIRKLKSVLDKAGVRHLYLLIDDFSELPEDAMKIVVDVLLAPMNNLSDELIKLKIAAYPGRIYLGAIDRSKIDEIYLDLFKLYGSGDITKLEESGQDFTRRLISQRISYFCEGDPFRFFDKNTDESFRQLFNAGLCNPRILGHILVYLHESHVTADKAIGVRAIGDAAKKFYEEKVESYFQTGRFLQEAFNERSSIFSLKELLESLVQRARELRRHNSSVFSKIASTPPTSHFHIPTQYETLLTTLELNFFLTKYFEMSDREGRKVAVYAMNFGLCEKYTITFGRPTGEREFRLYFVERVFDYSPLVLNYLKSNQEILCGNCGHRFEYADLGKLQFFGMKCNKCDIGVCSVTNLSRKYETELKAVSGELLLPRTELGILQTLDSTDHPMRPGEIAEEMDCSHQLIGRRAKNLEERQLVSRDIGEDGRRSYALTELAKKSYFDGGVTTDLILPELTTN
jgi:hypothetical protein